MWASILVAIGKAFTILEMTLGHFFAADKRKKEIRNEALHDAKKAKDEDNEDAWLDALNRYNGTR
jgi:hypothetical protein